MLLIPHLFADNQKEYIYLDGRAVAVETDDTQSGGVVCTYDIDPMNKSFTEYNSAGSVIVTTGDGCPWTANSNDSWITLNGGGSGNGTVSYTVP